MIKHVIGNWKMNGSTALVDSLPTHWPASDRLKVSLCLPYPYLSLAMAKLQGTGITIGAQNVSEFEQGAYTGEVCASMLADIGCRVVLIGHSERRQYFAEHDQQIAKKLQQAVAKGLFAVVCVGESLADRESGRAEIVIKQQLAALTKLAMNPAAMCIAYEPVWAIGTGLAATAEQIAGIHQMIKTEIGVDFAVLYRGSVSISNAAGIGQIVGVDGLLVGGVSLRSHEFVTICQSMLG